RSLSEFVDPIPARGPAGGSHSGRESDAPVLRSDGARAGESSSAPRRGCGASSARAESAAEAGSALHQPRLARRRPLANSEGALPPFRDLPPVIMGAKPTPQHENGGGTGE